MSRRSTPASTHSRRWELLVYSLDQFSPIYCQCIAQITLAHWAQPNILYLQFTPFTCTAHIPSLYKALYYTLLFTHQYTDYSVFLSHFTLLTWYQSHSSNFLVPVDISGILSLPSPSSSSHYQKRATAVTPTVPATLGYQLPKKRHRKTKQPIPSKTQPRTARNCITCAG